MKEYFAKLSSMERRFVVAVMLILFVVLNAWLVWPRFSDWKKNQGRMDLARKKLQLFDGKLARVPELERQIKQFESQGVSVPPDDQALDLANTIRRQAGESGVVIDNLTRVPERTNQFFVERAFALKTQTIDDKLVDFLYQLGAGNSLVRVRGLSLGPDAPRYNLRVDVTLVGSYQKKAPARAAAPATTSASTAPVAGKKADSPPPAPTSVSTGSVTKPIPLPPIKK